MKLNPDKKYSFQKKSNSIKGIVAIIILVTFLTSQSVSAQENEQTADNQDTPKVGVLRSDIIPVNPQDKENKKLFTYTLQPGSSIEDYLWLVNLSDEENVVKLYPTDGILSENDENLSYALENYDNQEIGAWVKLEEGPEFTLQPNEEKKLKFTVSIPENTEMKLYKGGWALQKTGEYNSDGIRNAFRKISRFEINVANEGQPIKEHTNEKPLITPYIWFGVGIFLITLVYYIVSTKKNKKKKKS